MLDLLWAAMHGQAVGTAKSVGRDFRQWVSQGGGGGWVFPCKYNKISSNRIPSFPGGRFRIRLRSEPWANIHPSVEATDATNR